MSLLQELQNLSEQDLTLKILMSLFKAMGYDTVEHHGGTNEGGKDLICRRSDEFGEDYIAVVQVKKFRPRVAAASSRSFSEVVTQLQQAKEKSIPCTDGTRRIPDGVIFVTPFALDTRALESRFEGYAALRNRGVRVIDGDKLTRLIARYIPNEITELFGTPIDSPDLLQDGLTNTDLMSALNQPLTRTLSQFYCDLDFGVGQTTSKLFMALKLTSRRERIELDRGAWGMFVHKLRQVEETLECAVAEPTIGEAEELARRQEAVWSSPTNQAHLKECSALQRECIDLTAYVSKENRELRNSLVPFLLESVEADVNTPRGRAKLRDRFRVKESTDEQTQGFAHDYLRYTNEFEKHAQAAVNSLLSKDSARITIEELDRATSEIAKCKSRIVAIREVLSKLKGLHGDDSRAGRPRDKKRGNLSDAYEQRRQHSEAIRTNVDDLSTSIQQFRKKITKRAPAPVLTTTLNGASLVSAMNRERAWFNEMVSQLSTASVSQTKLKETLLRAQQILSIVDSVLDDEHLASAISFERSSQLGRSDATPRLSMSIHEVFRTGINVSVFGEAGAGKTTTLQAYALGKMAQGDTRDIVWYLPLSRLISALPREIAEDLSIQSFAKFEHALCNYLGDRGVRLSTKDLRGAIAAKRVATFLLDGVDEIAIGAPWVVDSLPEFRRAYHNAQIIVSARATGPYLAKVDFLSFTLLPFTKDQLSKFIEGWSADRPAHIEAIHRHLATHPEVSTIVRNPLLATLLCVLAENGVPLPTSEISLYRERCRLLMGHYDIHKGVNRVSTHHSILDLVSRKLAFAMHHRNRRALPRATLLSIAEERTSGLFTQQILEQAIAELIDPCNILVPMDEGEAGNVGFGHLRYQEFFAASELSANRGIDLSQLLSAQWWRPVMILFAQMTDDIENIVETQILARGALGSTYDTLAAMSKARPGRHNEDLFRLLAAHHRIDEGEYEN
mgnify:CR=1 FL=1